MSEQNNNGCWKAAMIFLGVSVLIVGVLGAGAFVFWKKKGASSWAEFTADLPSAETGEVGEEVAGEVVALRPVVATAPIPAGADIYARYINRTDVLTLVNYYSDT